MPKHRPEWLRVYPGPLQNQNQPNRADKAERDLHRKQQHPIPWKRTRCVHPATSPGERYEEVSHRQTCEKYDEQRRLLAERYQNGVGDKGHEEDHLLDFPQHAYRGKKLLESDGQLAHVYLVGSRFESKPTTPLSLYHGYNELLSSRVTGKVPASTKVCEIAFLRRRNE